MRAILGTVHEVVHAVARDDEALFDGTAPVLRAVSPLAEGTDRLFAEQAVALSFELCCVMPFPQAEYEKDFQAGEALEPDSLERFRHLVAGSATRFELDGDRVDEGAAYGAAGLVVLNQSDLLVVVWDGRRENKRGGTEEILDEAQRRGVPIVWVDARAPHAWMMLEAGTPLPRSDEGVRAIPQGSGSLESLGRAVREALVLPVIPERESPAKRGPIRALLDRAWGAVLGHGSEEPRTGIAEYYAERQPRWSLAVVWRVFRDLVGDGRRPSVGMAVEPFEAAANQDWPRDSSTPIAGMVDRLRPFYAWPDKLAVLYADRYRSAFLLAYLLAAAAVGMALLPLGAGFDEHSWPETSSIVLELVAILVILGLVLGGSRKHWHERWLDYRLTAELVRHLRLVAPLGGGRPFPQVPAHLATYGLPGATWMAWYVRAVERAIGLPSVVVDRAHLQAGLRQLEELVRGQVVFHRQSSERHHRIETRLHRCGIALIGLTFLCCVLHLVHGFIHVPDWLPPLLTSLCGFFPALCAALAGINNQGEFRRIARRSEAVHDQLQILHKNIQALHQEVASGVRPVSGTHSARAVLLAGDAAGLMVNEVLDWRVALLDRPLHTPA